MNRALTNGEKLRKAQKLVDQVVKALTKEKTKIKSVRDLEDFTLFFNETINASAHLEHAARGLRCWEIFSEEK